MTWTEEKNRRRCQLINLKILRRLNRTEAKELSDLQKQMLQHSRRVAPLPIEAAESLYQKLLADSKEGGK